MTSTHFEMSLHISRPKIDGTDTKCQKCEPKFLWALLWRYNEREDVPNHLRLNCLLNRSFRRRSKKTSKLRVTGLCEGNLSGTSEFPAQRASNADNVSIWWRHHVRVTRALSQYKIFPGMWISIIKMWRMRDHLIFIMGISMLIRHLYIETGPRWPNSGLAGKNRYVHCLYPSHSSVTVMIYIYICISP